MITVRKSIEIDATPGEVYDFISKPENFPLVWPSMVEVSNITLNADGSRSFDWVYKMAGIRFHGRSETVEAKPGKLIVSKNAKGIKSTFRWHFEPHGKGTLFTIECEYEIPGALGKLAKPLVEKLNEREAEMTLANTKLKLEEGRAAKAKPAHAHA